MDIERIDWWERELPEFTWIEYAHWKAWQKFKEERKIKLKKEYGLFGIGLGKNGLEEKS